MPPAEVGLCTPWGGWWRLGCYGLDVEGFQFVGVWGRVGHLLDRGAEGGQEELGGGLAAEGELVEGESGEKCLVGFGEKREHGGFPSVAGAVCPPHLHIHRRLFREHHRTISGVWTLCYEFRCARK